MTRWPSPVAVHSTAPVARFTAETPFTSAKKPTPPWKAGARSEVWVPTALPVLADSTVLAPLSRMYTLPSWTTGVDPPPPEQPVVWVHALAPVCRLSRYDTSHA